MVCSGVSTIFWTILQSSVKFYQLVDDKAPIVSLHWCAAVFSTICRRSYTNCKSTLVCSGVSTIFSTILQPIVKFYQFVDDLFTNCKSTLVCRGVSTIFRRFFNQLSSSTICRRSYTKCNFTLVCNGVSTICQRLCPSGKSTLE